MEGFIGPLILGFCVWMLLTLCAPIPPIPPISCQTSLMRYILTSVVFVILLFPALGLGETMDDLVEREGIHYKKFSYVPFTGKVTGKKQGSF